MSQDDDAARFGQPSARIDPASSFAPFRWPVFRAIWIASVASALGSLIQQTAAAWLMTELTDSHLLVALVQASVTIPVLGFGLFAGVIADNYDRRIVMLVANCGMLAISAALAVLALSETVTPWSLLLLTLAIGLGFALNGPAWQASIRQLVPRSDIPQAISFNTIAYNTARSLGPAIGGLLLSLSGPALAFSVNTLSYLGLIFILLRWRPQSTARDVPHRVFPAIGTALSFAWTASPMRRVLLRGIVFGVGSISFQALLPLVAKEQLGGNEIGFGLMFGAFGVGSVITAFWIAGIRRRYGPEAIVSVATLVSAGAVTLLAFAPSITVAMVAGFLAGCGHVSALTSFNVSVQMRSPDELLGRCLSLFQATIFGGMAVGAGIWGTVSDEIGLTTALVTSAVWLVGTLAVLRVASPMPKIGEGTVAH